MSIYDYTNAHDYLAERVSSLDQKAFGEFLGQLSLDNPRVFFDLIKGRKSLKVHHSRFLQKALKLSEVELQYFQLLIKHQDVKSKTEKDLIGQLLKEKRHTGSNSSPINKGLIGQWRGKTNIVGEEGSIPQPFNSNGAHFAVDESARELKIESETINGLVCSQLVPYATPLAKGKQKVIKLEKETGIETSEYRVNQISESTTQIDVKWRGPVCDWTGPEGYWGIWKVLLALDASQNKLFANIFSDGNGWGRASSYCEFERVV